MPAPSLESLPYDIFLHILLAVDGKPDLDNLCLALPNSAGKLVQRHPGILDKIYWKEIEQDYLLPVALLNFGLYRSHEAARILDGLNLQTLEPSFTQFRNSAGDPGSSDGTGNHHNPGSLDTISDRDTASIDKATIESLDAQTISQMKTLHLQIEKLADIFIDHQLKPHYSPTSSQTYQPPTASERKRVMKAIYNTWVMILEVMTRPEYQSYYPTDPDIADPIPVLLRDIRIYPYLRNSWGFWNAKETEVVLDVLWKEIPKRVTEEGFGRQWPDIDIVESRKRKRIGRGWDIQMDDSTTIHITQSIELLSFIFTGKNFDLQKHAELLECLGNKEKAAAAMNALVLSDKSLRLIFAGPGPRYSEPVTMFRTRLLRHWNTELKYLQTEGMCRVGEGIDGSMYCVLPLRRLVKGQKKVTVVPTIKSLAKNDNWTLAEEVVIRDCMWDDWRLEGWGYQFPEYIGDT